MNEVSETKSHINSKKTDSEFLKNIEFIEIDLVEKAQTLWAGRWTIAIFVALFLLFGYFHLEYGAVEYTSTSSLIQESEGASVSDFGSSFLRSLTGMNIQTGGSGNMSAVATGRAPLPVSLYPEIINSTQFQKELIQSDLEFRTLGSSISLFEYYHEYREPSLRDKVYDVVFDYTIFLPATFFRWISRLIKNVYGGLTSLWSDGTSNQTSRDNSVTDTIEDPRLLSLTSEERSVIEWLRVRISLTSNNGIMVISTTLPDPKAAALLNAELVDYIQDFITDYRVQKAKQNLDSTLERYDLAKERYEEAQYELAQYRDQNINVSSQTASIEATRLSNEASLRFNIYNSVAQEVEQARMVLQQQIPVFNPLEKPSIPSSPSTGSSPLFMVISGLLGFFIAVGWILVRSIM